MFSAHSGGKRLRYLFPDFSPMTEGNVSWKLTIEDGDEGGLMELIRTRAPKGPQKSEGKGKTSPKRTSSAPANRRERQRVRTRT